MEKAVKKSIVVAAIIFAGLAGWHCTGGKGAVKMKSPQQKKAEVYRLYPAPAWEKMPEPQPGDWLHWRKEPGQTFEEYSRRIRGKRANPKGIIYLQPLGDIDTKTVELFEQMSEFISIYFEREVRLQKPIPLPEKAYKKRRRQYDGSRILDELKRDFPADALARVGITTEDLYSGDLNFVFGLGSPQAKVGIYSLHRYTGAYPGCESHNTVLRRALKVVAHEIGHIFHIDHCIFFKCVMNGSNSLPEADSRPMALCPLDEKKLRYYMRYNQRKRYEKLERFYRQNNMGHDADFVEKIQKKPSVPSPGKRSN